MDVVVSTEQRFYLTPDGAVWCPLAVFGPRYWDRYLDVFDRVVVLARVESIVRPADGWTRVDGGAIGFHALPSYVGPLQHVARLRAVLAAIDHAAARDAAFIFRVPSIIATHACRALARRGHPFALEVVGDPWDVFAAGAVDTPLRPFLRRWFTWSLRRQCASAIATSYVTTHALQRRYPPRAGAVSVAASSVDLPAAAFSAARQYPAPLRAPRLVTVGTMERRYKGVDVLLEAVARARRRTPSADLQLTVVGAGRHLDDLLALAARLGLGESVRFVGQLPSPEAVRSELDAADLFVLASRTEGLPRAMLEAMARGLPCVGTSVGGIPELLPPERCVPPDEPDALLAAITSLTADPARLTAASRRDFETSLSYRAEVLQRLRRRFYEEVRRATQEHLDQAARVGGRR